MKKFICALSVFFISLYAFSYGKYLSGAEGKLNVIKTQYFDIIFPDKSEETALKINAVCDSYYEELCGIFEYEPYQSFSVVITDQVEMSNAFFTLAPYNLIVLYDYPVALSINNNKDEIEAVFYHELTHAVSLNSKAPGWRAMSFFGDLFTPAGISLTSFWYEGAAVAAESLENGGRLNDPYFNQIILDAKYKAVTGQKKFPSWRDVTGARDIYPYGNDAYVFGAHFARYLIQTYGLSKYAQFWKNAGTSTNFSFCAGVFKKTYGLKLTAAWNDFYESIKLPEIDLEKRKEFVSSKNLISKKGSVIESADSYFNEKTGKYDTVWFDSLSHGLYLNGKKIITIKNVQAVRFCDDGTKLYVNRLKDKDNVKNDDFIYDLKTKKRTVVPHDSKNFEKTHGARFVKEGLTWYLEYEDKTGQKVRWNFEDRILHHLHFMREDENSVSFVFTWAKLFSKTMARAGIVTVDKNTLEAKISLQKNDNFTGLIETVPAGSQFDFAVITEEYDCHPLRPLTLSEDDFEDFAAVKTIREQAVSIAPEGELSAGGVPAPETAISEPPVSAPAGELPAGEVPVSAPAAVTKPEYHSYNPFKYYLRGVILPFGTVGLYNHNLDEQASIFFGGTFISSNPWLDKMIQLSLAYDPDSNTGGALFSFSGGDDCFTYSFSSTAVFDSKGYKQSCASFNLSQVFWQGDYAYSAAGAEGSGVYGKDGLDTEVKVTDKDDTTKTKKTKYSCKGLTLDIKPYLYFSTVHRVKPGYSQTAGFYFMPFLDIEYQKIKKTYEDDYLPSSDMDSVYYNAGGTLAVKLPGFFPSLWTVNFFPEKGYFASASSKIQFFSFDIQKGIPAVSLYAQRVLFYLTYLGSFEYTNEDRWDVKRTQQIARDLTEDDYADYLRLSGEVQLSLNTSYFASSGAVGLGAYTQYHFNGEDRNTWKAGLYVNVAW